MTPGTPGNSGHFDTHDDHDADRSEVATLLSLLERQSILYKTLRSLSDRQESLIAGGQSEMLLSLLARRQKLIDDAAALNMELEPYRRRWASIWDGLDDVERQTIGDLVRGIQQLIGTIVQQDEQNRQALQAAKGRAGAELVKQ